jgi:hypothetical protein
MREAMRRDLGVTGEADEAARRPALLSSPHPTALISDFEEPSDGPNS